MFLSVSNVANRMCVLSLFSRLSSNAGICSSKKACVQDSTLEYSPSIESNPIESNRIESLLV